MLSQRAFLLTSMTLLSACATVPSSSGTSSRGALRLDTYSTYCAKNPADCAEGAGTHAASKSLSVASSASRGAPIAATLVLRDTEPEDELERRLVDCAVQADQKVNHRWFGDRRPTDDECLERVDVEVDGCMESMRRAAALGREKHIEALACARKVLDEVWGDLYSIEQRYRFYRQNRLLERVSSEEEKRLLEQGCTQELWRTIKPDIVLHVRDNRRLACRVFDFKFPCLEGKQPQWTQYGETSAFAGSDQGTIYTEALGCKAVMISPKGVFR